MELHPGANDVNMLAPGVYFVRQTSGVALTSVELHDHSEEYGVKVQLAGLRF